MFPEILRFDRNVEACYVGNSSITTAPEDREELKATKSSNIVPVRRKLRRDSETGTY